jgi:hypothetical protein
MSLPASTLATYQAIGNREDLTDMIYRIAPVDTPFVSGVEREKATATLHEWQTQDLATAATNAQLEGDDSATNSTTVTVRLNNICANQLQSGARFRHPAGSPARRAKQRTGLSGHAQGA